jgi:ubiquitin-large subunit ribosomal protein L40e
MGKFPIADAEISKIRICKRCKARNGISRHNCRKCGYGVLRPKKKDVKAKGGAK